MMKTSQALVELLNRTDAGFVVFAHMFPMRIFRVSCSVDFKTFRVERFHQHNTNPNDPKGAWQTLATLGHEMPGMRLSETFQFAIAEQTKYINQRVQRAKAKQIVRVPG